MPEPMHTSPQEMRSITRKKAKKRAESRKKAKTELSLMKEEQETKKKSDSEKEEAKNKKGSFSEGWQLGYRAVTEAQKRKR